MIEQGTCIVALDEHNPERILGCVIAGVLVPSSLDSFAAQALAAKDNIWGKMVTLLMKASVEGNVYERYGVSKVLLSHMTTVDPSMRGKGLGTRLAAALMEVGRIKGYEVMIAFCSSFYSARQKRAMGMECIYSLAYADYKDESGEVIFKPPAPHTHLQFLAIRL
ncbi:dopamine N-acetyltransferase [Drosophila busckii]|uniref:dopamine N-acetyltransferase n=1 Tax=Drosophila busckii TaxID=30019 RepID=UPI001432C1E0|nr:dopamine N-acetyltransferase [Drosophila busckii]